MNSLFIFQLKLKLQALDLHLPFSFVFKYLLVWFAMLWRGRIPSVSTVILGVVGPQNGQIADDVTIRTADNSNLFKEALLSR